MPFEEEEQASRTGVRLFWLSLRRGVPGSALPPGGGTPSARPSCSAAPAGFGTRITDPPPRRSRRRSMPRRRPPGQHWTSRSSPPRAGPAQPWACAERA